ncbi:MAG: DNA topoisomerase I [Candidatus Thermoplasmatota archaeon]|nr:DNA topoisomerase I [Candidatus Thermoplasmatota archaeon]
MKLIVCEKDDAAKRIAGILSGDTASKERRGKVSIYKFRWKNAPACAIGLRGHILNLDYPKKFKDWSGTDPADLTEVEPIKVVSERSIASTLKSLVSEADVIYMATDYDREGELIGLEAITHAISGEGEKKLIRVKFSSLTKEEVMASFSKMHDIDRNLANSAEARQIIDLTWGASLTRFISLASNRVGHEFLSVGRVQSPTLALIVDKEKDIKSFVPEPYWNIEADLHREMTFTSAHGARDIHDEQLALDVHSRIADARSALIVDVSERERIDKVPPPFNTTSFIKAANNLGLSAARIMSIAEDLYTNGYISYPRTDNTVYPPTLDLRDCVRTLNRGPYSKEAEYILSKVRLVPSRGDKETTDHPPIYPTEYAELGQLSGDRFKVYDLIVRRFLATLHDPARVLVRSLKIDIRSEPFTASGITVIYPGWRNIYHYSKVNETALPDLGPGDKVDVVEVRLLSKETKPPKRYSQGSLIQEMERLGLGTKSTRHEIIQKLYDRRFIEDSPPRPTLSGEALILSLERHASTITKPDMTARLESDMDLIASGNREFQDVVEESRSMLRDLMPQLKRNREAIGKEINDALMEQNIAGKCPRCDNNMHLVKSRWGKRYVRCSKYPGCSRSFPLPQRGKVTFTMDRCEICRSPIITLYRRKGPPYNKCINPKCPNGRYGSNENEHIDAASKELGP